jgi:hypothetical protein
VIELDHALVVRLRPKAARRDVPVVRLIHDLLDVIAADQLTGAILDDGEGSAPPSGKVAGASGPAGR